ncbi:MAG: alpha/beta hydrolase [Bacteroidota bacterium]|nr:alpha/beta hydrolase [Bacteroidota bacterium]
MKTFLFAILLFTRIPLSFSQIINDSVYKEAAITLHTATGDIFGTLALPNNSHPHAVALIIAGSGPTDRNCNNPSMKNDTYKKLAAALAENDIASIRYDKRGVAESRQALLSESAIRFDDYVHDAKDWIQLIKKDDRFSSVIVIGHSEGSLIGMLSCVEGAAKFISLAGAGRPADEILKAQLHLLPQPTKDVVFPIIDSLKQGMLVKDVPITFYSLFRPSVQPYIISWFKYNPASVISTLKIPVLIINGSSDLQVQVEDAEKLHAADPTSEIMIAEKVNHILRKVSSKEENIKSYNDPSSPLDTSVLHAIVDFIKR